MITGYLKVMQTVNKDCEIRCKAKMRRLFPLLKEICHCSVDVGEIVGISAAAGLLRGLHKAAELQLPGLLVTA